MNVSVVAVRLATLATVDISAFIYILSARELQRFYRSDCIRSSPGELHGTDSDLGNSVLGLVLN